MSNDTPALWLGDESPYELAVFGPEAIDRVIMTAEDAQGPVYVTQPADKPTAFTFCTQSEFNDLLKKWRDNLPGGQATQIESSTYDAAFMPHLEKGICTD